MTLSWRLPCWWCRCWIWISSSWWSIRRLWLSNWISWRCWIWCVWTSEANCLLLMVLLMLLRCTIADACMCSISWMWIWIAIATWWLWIGWTMTGAVRWEIMISCTQMFSRMAFAAVMFSTIVLIVVMFCRMHWIMLNGNSYDMRFNDDWITLKSRKRKLTYKWKIMQFDLVVDLLLFFSANLTINFLSRYTYGTLIGTCTGKGTDGKNRNWGIFFDFILCNNMISPFTSL